MKTFSKRDGAFTLVELLVIIAMVGVLVVMLAPALASTKDHAQRASCANNLRELGLGTSVYAEHYDGRYPITQAGGNPVNVINGGFYTRWVFQDTARPGFHLAQTWDAGTAPDNPDAGGIKTGTFWRNFGMLYPEKLASDGNMFFCPGLNAKNSIIGSSLYQPLLTTDSVAGSGGSVRASYLYNPWVDSNNLRLYVKTSDVKSRVVFGLDEMDLTMWNSDGSVNTGVGNFGHTQARGWNVLFSDNSVNFQRVDKRITSTVFAFFSSFNSASDISGIDRLCGTIFEK